MGGWVGGCGVCTQTKTGVWLNEGGMGNCPESTYITAVCGQWTPQGQVSGPCLK